MGRDKFKTYNNYVINFYNEEMTQLASFKKDRNLCHVQKKLITGRIELKNKKFQCVINELEKLSPENDFLKAERYALLGSCHSLLSNFEESAKFSELANRYYAITEDQLGQFNVNYNMSVAFNRLGLDSLSDYYLTQAKKHVGNINQEILIKRAIACSYSRQEDYQKATKIIDGLFNLTEQMREFDELSFYAVAIDIYSKAGQFRKALEICSFAKSKFKCREKGRVYFYHRILNFIVHKDSLGKKPNSVKEIKEFDLQWNVLESLLNGEKNASREYWNELIVLFPNFYGPNFSCLDKLQKNNIFFQAIESILNTDQVVSIKRPIIKGKVGNKLFDLLANSSTPLRKEDIIEAVWQTSYEPSLDSRFYKLVERLKSNYQVNIINERYTYRIA